MNAVSSAATPLSIFISSMIVAQSLGPGGRGYAASASALSSILVVLGSIGLPDAITYYVARNRGITASARRGTTLIALAASLLVSIAGALIVLGPVGAEGTEKFAFLVACASVMPSTILGLVRASAAGSGAWTHVAVDKLIGAVARVGSLAVLALFDALSAEAAICAMIIAPYAGASVYLGSGALQPRESRAPEDQLLASARSIAKYGSTAWVGAAAGALMARADQVVMLPLVGVVAVGVYAVAVNLSELVLIINQPLREVFFAHQAARNDVEATASAARLSGLASFAIALVVAVASPWVIPIAFGEEFAGALWPIAIMSFSLALSAPGAVAGVALSGRGAPGLRSTSIAVGMVVSLGTLFLLAPVLGPTGAAIATAAGTLATSSMNLWFHWVRFRVSPVIWMGVRRRDLIAVRENLSAMARGR